MRLPFFYHLLKSRLLAFNFTIRLFKGINARLDRELLSVVNSGNGHVSLRQTRQTLHSAGEWRPDVGVLLHQIYQGRRCG